MLTGETTQRSDLDPDILIDRLCGAGVDQLRDDDHLWVVFDETDLRKPHAQCMEHLQEVRRLAGGGMVPGYVTLNVLGIGQSGRRGLLDHRLFSSRAPDFVSEPAEVRAAIRRVGRRLATLETEVTAILDRGFDDQAYFAEVWAQGWHVVCRVKHEDRLVHLTPDGPTGHLRDSRARCQPLAQVETELVARKIGQRREKLQPVTVPIGAVPIHVPITWRPEPGVPEETFIQPCWLVEAQLDRVDSPPWLLLTDRPVETAEAAIEVFRMYCQRWAIEDAFKVAKSCLGLEEVQVLRFEAVRLLVALGWVAAGFLFRLGVTLEWAEVRLLRRLGGGEERPTRPPGKIVLMRGLQRLYDLLTTEAILADEVARHGPPPPRIAALLGPDPDST